MPCTPPSQQSLAELRKLCETVSERGEECLAMLLNGIEMYVAVGREWELLETMREFAHDAGDMVQNTPTAEELRRLYETDEGEQPR